MNDQIKPQGIAAVLSDVFESTEQYVRQQLIKHGVPTEEKLKLPPTSFKALVEEHHRVGGHILKEHSNRFQDAACVLAAVSASMMATLPVQPGKCGDISPELARRRANAIMAHEVAASYLGLYRAKPFRTEMYRFVIYLSEIMNLQDIRSVLIAMQHYADAYIRRGILEKRVFTGPRLFRA